jgi:hypothetical protein
LSTLVSSLGLPFGHGGAAVVVWIVLLSFGALVWLTYRLGQELFGRWVGVAAALVVIPRRRAPTARAPDTRSTSPLEIGSCVWISRTRR